MRSTAIFYSFNTIKTAQIAKHIIDGWFDDIDVLNVDNMDFDVSVFSLYNNLLLGVPTWFDGEFPNYWDELIPGIEELDLSGKHIALFGLADQKGYPENFADAIGLMANIVKRRGAKLIGYTSIEGYQFETSQAQCGDQFCGLVLDQENQARLTPERINSWIQQLKGEIK